MRFYLLCTSICLFAVCHLAMAAENCRVPNYPFVLSCNIITPPHSKFLPFAITAYQVDARVRYPLPSPVIWIPDGLGLVSNERAPAIINTLSRLRNARDLVWLSFTHLPDKPTFDCQLKNDKSTQTSALKLDTLINRLYRANDKTMRNQCKHTVEALGGLKHFDYMSIAQLYEHSAQQLGLKQVTIFAEGRGALIAAAWHSIAPQRILFQVLDSPARINQSQENQVQAEALESALLRVFTHCGDNTFCHQQFKHTAQDWLQLIDKLPMTTQVKDPMTLQTVSLTIDAEMLAAWSSQLLRQPHKSRYLPLLLTHALANDWQPMVGLLANGWQNESVPFNYALAMAEQCAYRNSHAMPDLDIPKIARWFYKSEHNRIRLLCEGLAPYQPKKIAPNQDTPSLILLGLVNPMVDKSWPKSQHLTIVKSTGAGQNVLSHACTKDVIYRYFKLQDYLLKTKSSADQTLAIKKELPRLDSSCFSNIPFPQMGYRDPTILQGQP